VTVGAGGEELCTVIIEKIQMIRQVRFGGWKAKVLREF
jgi:hypothetical protein